MAIWLITGASRGIGRAIAEVALEAGHSVVATARQPATLEALVAAYPDRCWAYPLDVCERSQAFALAHQLQREGRSPNVLVNNAGYGLVGAFETLPEAAILRQVDTNLLGLLWVTQAFLPALRQNAPSFIFNISSIAGYFGFKGATLYNATKFAVTGFSEALAQELAPFGIWVSNVAPGPYRTDWAGASLEKSPALAQPDPRDPYYELHQLMRERYAQMDGQQPGDPKHIGRVLLNCVEMGWAPKHLILGDEAQQTWYRYEPLRVWPELQFIGHRQEKPHRPG